MAPLSLPTNLSTTLLTDLQLLSVLITRLYRAFFEGRLTLACESHCSSNESLSMMDMMEGFWALYGRDIEVSCAVLVVIEHTHELVLHCTQHEEIRTNETEVTSPDPWLVQEGKKLSSGVL